MFFILVHFHRVNIIKIYGSGGAEEKVLCVPLRNPLSPFVFNFKVFKHKGSQSKQPGNTKAKIVFE
jgi:hypothetical protein